MTVGLPHRLVLLATVTMLAAGSAAAQDHPGLQPPLTPDGPYPRCSTRDLELGGFPDHMHVWHWSTWETPVDADGETYGPGSLCRRRQLLVPREGLELEPAVKCWRQFVIEHNPGYQPCDMLPFLELVDLAHRRQTALLGLDPPDTLVLVNPDNTNQYREMTGQGTWRLYKREGDRVVLQGVGTLQARTLDGHAAHMLMAEWLLDRGVGVELPRWLTHGLALYLAEHGVHLMDFMAEFRGQGPILLPPPVTESILASEVNPDPWRDRQMYRRAGYSAFLMAWELVENQGGMPALREFLQAVSGGADPDAAAKQTWGMDLAELAKFLDPVQLGEPIGPSAASHMPEREP